MLIISQGDILETGFQVEGRRVEGESMMYSKASRRVGA
jgi:hypothetical protein